MKVLVTGTNAAHYSSLVSQRTLTYSGMLAYAAQELRHEVTQIKPSVSWTQSDLKKYDKIFLGIGTVVSVVANGTYGALNLLSLMKNDPRLVLYIDAPEPGKIFAGLRSVDRKPDELFKPFYARRDGHKAVVTDKKLKSSIIQAARLLLNDRWPKTLWPTLPWHCNPDDIAGIGENVKSSLVGLSFDALYTRAPSAEALQSRRIREWGIDLPSTRWARSIARVLSFPHGQIKHKKYVNSAELSYKIRSLTGVILTIHDDSQPWWSPLFLESMRAGTPIVTEWRHSQKTGDAWTLLPANVESMSTLDLYEASVRQSIQYLDKIQHRQEVLTTLAQVIDTQ